MNRTIFACIVPMLISVSVAQAQESCARWSAGDTGTGQTMASICTGPAEKLIEIYVMCGGENALSLRYLPVIDQEPEGDGKVDIRWTAAGETISMPMQFEADDGAFAAYPALSDRIVTLLRTADSIEAVSSDGKYGPHRFTLAGSTKAIAAALKSCP